MLNGPKSEKLKGACDIFDLSNIVKDPTCFISRNKPSLLDVILVNHASFIGKTFNLKCGLSDMHNFIGFQLNIDVRSNKSKWRNYRSFKNFDVESFNIELGSKLSQTVFSEVGMLVKCMRILPIRLHLLLITLLPKKSKNACLNLFHT